VEDGESPDQCICREIREEMGLELKGFRLFDTFELSDRIENTYWVKMNFDTETIGLMEGQKIDWFTQGEIEKLRLAFSFNKILTDFFSRKPWV
jgi:8-oxo-dGTP diphosphatase